MSDNPSPQVGTLPPQILENLRKYSTHSHELTCLECGYKGIMGIKKKGGHPFLSGVGALIVTMVFAITGNVGMYLSPAIFGAALALIYQSTTRPILNCPNCSKDLRIRK